MVDSRRSGRDNLKCDDGSGYIRKEASMIRPLIHSILVAGLIVSVHSTQGQPRGETAISGVVTPRDASPPIEARGKVRAIGAAVVRRVAEQADGEPLTVVFDGPGKVEIEKSKARRKQRDEVTFYAFGYRPNLEREGDKAVSYVEIAGLPIGYRLDSSGALAELVVLDGGGEIGPPEDAPRDSWKPVGVVAPVGANGSLATVSRIVVRVDTRHGIADIYSSNELMMANIPLTRPGRVEEVLAHSAGEGETVVAGLEILDHNPMFEDGDVDGVPDAFAADKGAAGRFDPLPGQSGKLLIDAYMERRSGSRR